MLPPQLFANVAYYAFMAQYPRAVIDWDLRYDKRFKSVHRYAIADASGELRLTVPVSRPEGAFLAGNLTWAQVAVSDHGRWWEVHGQALESAYGRTPYFEFYIDRFAPLFTPEPRSICTMAADADRIIRAILGLETEIVEAAPADAADCRRTDFSVLDAPEPYWQLRADRYGFMPRLSVLDLIFNQGPEAPLYLQAKS